MNSHLFGPVDQRGNHDKHIIHRSRKDEHKSQKAQQGIHALHLITVTVHVHQRNQAISQINSRFFHLFQIAMPSLHLTNGSRQAFRISAGIKFYISQITVIPQPIFTTPLAHTFQRCNNLKTQVGIFRYIFKHTSYRIGLSWTGFKFKFLVHCLFCTSQQFGNAIRDHHISRTGQSLFRITDQDRTRQQIENIRIAHHDITGGITVSILCLEQLLVTPDIGQTSCFFNLRYLDLHSCSHASAHLPVGLIFTIPDDVFVQPINTVAVRIKLIKRTFKTHFRYQDKSHRQSDSQR